MTGSKPKAASHRSESSPIGKRTPSVPCRPEQLHEIFDLCVETGTLFHKARREGDIVKSGPWDRVADWNKMYAGKPAGWPKANGYISVRAYGKDMLAHRVIYAMVHNEWPNLIDHINGLKSDNRPQNLRSVTVSENQKNTRMRSNNTSGCPGVYWFKPAQRWTATVSSEGKYICLGYFRQKEDAIAARKEAEVKYGYHENHGRK